MANTVNKPNVWKLWNASLPIGSYISSSSAAAFRYLNIRKAISIQEQALGLVTTDKLDGKKGKGRQRGKAMDGLFAWRNRGKNIDLIYDF